MELDGKIWFLEPSESDEQEYEVSALYVILRHNSRLWIEIAAL